MLAPLANVVKLARPYVGNALQVAVASREYSDWSRSGLEDLVEGRTAAVAEGARSHLAQTLETEQRARDVLAQRGEGG